MSKNRYFHVRTNNTVRELDYKTYQRLAFANHENINKKKFVVLTKREILIYYNQNFMELSLKVLNEILGLTRDYLPVHLSIKEVLGE